MNTDKIRAAVKTCLNESVNGYGEYPFIRVRAYIYGLRADPEWSDAEVMEVQMQVIRTLLSQLNRQLIEPNNAQCGPIKLGIAVATGLSNVTVVQQ